MPQEETEDKPPLGSTEAERDSPSSGGILDSASSFFSSIFGNNSSSDYDVRNDIRNQLNQFDELQYLRSKRREVPDRPSRSRQAQYGEEKDLDHQPEPEPQREKTTSTPGYFRLKDFFSLSGPSFVSYRAKDGAYYVIREDPTDGARIDVQPPFMIPKHQENGGMEVEVVRESNPCQIRWKREEMPSNDPFVDNDYADQDLGRHISKVLGVSDDSFKRPKPKKNYDTHLIELDDYIDCARLSASVYRTRNLLTLKAPVKQQEHQKNIKITSSSTTKQQHDSVEEQPLPRSIPVVKRS